MYSSQRICGARLAGRVPRRAVGRRRHRVLHVRRLGGLSVRRCRQSRWSCGLCLHMCDFHAHGTSPCARATLRFGVAYSLAGAVATAGSPGLQPDTREWCGGAPSHFCVPFFVPACAMLPRACVMPFLKTVSARADGCLEPVFIPALSSAPPTLFCASIRDAARERLRRVAEAAHDLGCASLLSGS